MKGIGGSGKEKKTSWQNEKGRGLAGPKRAKRTKEFNIREIAQHSASQCQEKGKSHAKRWR